MPIYCEVFQLVYLKSAIEEKYPGGLNQFKTDKKWGSKHDHEDQLLISFGQMGGSYPIEKYFHFDEETQSSADYVLVARHSGGLMWEIDWCLTNLVYIWHKNISEETQKKIDEYCNVTMDKIAEHYEVTGEFLLKDFD